MFVWVDPINLEYGSSMVVAVAETVEQAREIAQKSPSYLYGNLPGADRNLPVLGEPTRVVDIPCAEWYEWPA